MVLYQSQYKLNSLPKCCDTQSDKLSLSTLGAVFKCSLCRWLAQGVYCVGRHVSRLCCRCESSVKAAWWCTSGKQLPLLAQLGHTLDGPRQQRRRQEKWGVGLEKNWRKTNKSRETTDSKMLNPRFLQPNGVSHSIPGPGNSSSNSPDFNPIFCTYAWLCIWPPKMQQSQIEQI